MSRKPTPFGALQCIVTLACASVAAPAVAQDAAVSAPAAPDASVNAPSQTTEAPAPHRHGFDLGAFIDDVTLRPISKCYKHWLPRPVRKSVHNVLVNLDEPDVAVNDMLQGHPKSAAVAVLRFAANTTVGVAGLWDPAQHIGLAHHDNDAAQTLATYRVPDGPDFHVPLIETDNAREAVGFAIDFFMDPVGWARFPNSNAVYAGQLVMNGIDERASEPAEDLPPELAAADLTPLGELPALRGDTPIVER